MLKWRADQIKRYVDVHEAERYAVVDDLELQIDNFVQTDGACGLTYGHVTAIIRLLKGER